MVASLSPRCYPQVGQGGGTHRSAQGMFKEPGGHRQNFVELLSQGELSLQFLPFGRFQGFDRHLVALGQIQHHIGKGALVQLHQKLEGIAPRPAGKAVVKLLTGADAKAGRLVFVEGAEPDKVFALLFQHHMLGDNIDNIGAIAHRFDGVGVKAGGIHKPQANRTSPYP
jgi:hypothetical protein